MDNIDSSETLLHTLANHASDPEHASCNALECAQDSITYAQLWSVVTGLAAELESQFGPRPTLAIVSENHPYIIAIIFATWSIGGIVAPLDIHASKVLMEGMLTKIAPHGLVASSMDDVTQAISTTLGIKKHVFAPDSSSIPALLLRFVTASTTVTTPFKLPSAESPAVYLFTSSATSVSNLKAVRVPHNVLYLNCFSQISWIRSHYPETSFDNVRFLGWAPFSHIMALSHDIGACVLLTGGCYLFATTPTHYPVPVPSPSADIPTRLLNALLTKSPQAISGVPWALEGLMKLYENEDTIRRGEYEAAFKNLKIYISGGANTSDEIVQWSNRVGIPLTLAIGMTELGGALFYCRADQNELGWLEEECIIPAAVLMLIGDDSQDHPTEGELYVRSKLICHSYLGQQSPAFTVNPDGTTTLRTGDIYRRIVSCGRPYLQWTGRREDFIQLLSGEVIDPRVAERFFDSYPGIARSCVIGNNFLDGPAQYICAIIQPNHVEESGSDVSLSFLRALAIVNRDLAPPLRISWSRVLILSNQEPIPVTRKGDVFRKKLRALFGERLSTLLNDPSASRLTHSLGGMPSTISDIVLDVVCENLRLSRTTIESNREYTFAEFGMDSTMAISIVNGLNHRLSLDMPPNACHVYINLQELTTHVIGKLGPTMHSCPPRQFNISEQPHLVVEDVVIVGQSMRLPGQLNSPESFWEALLNRRDMMAPIPEKRWDHASFYQPDPKQARPGDISFNRAGFVDFGSFDNTFFGITGPEALSVSPNTRLILEAAFDALEDANIPLSKIRGTDMSVFVANGPDDGYVQLLTLQYGFEAFNRFYGTGVGTGGISGRLSYLLDIHGPSMTIDTACSGGMVALDSAIRHLQTGGGESALVCGVNTHASPGVFGFISARHMASPNGRCATFSNAADGYASSEGAIVFVLKTRSAALRDHDHVLASIKASSVRHNGRSQGYGAPSFKAQVSLYHDMLTRSSLTPVDIDLVETHGSGTSLGDLVEIDALTDVFVSSHTSSRPLLIGASKTCVGHTESVAGLVGIATTLLSFKHHLVPGLVHLKESNLNPRIDTAAIPMIIPWETVPLSSRQASNGDKLPYRAMVLAYGFYGTLAGTVLESEPPSMVENLRESNISPAVFVASAKSPNALREYLEKYITFCDQAADSDFYNICYTGCLGREHYKYRFSCVASTLQDLSRQLQNALEVYTNKERSPVDHLIFAFPGQGSQFQGMGRDLASNNSGFRSILVEMAEMADSIAGFSVLPFLLESNAPAGYSIDSSEQAQVCIFIYQCAICKWLVSLDIHPHAVLGHSIGEIAASVLGGAIPFKLALEFIVFRARAMRPDPRRPACMAAIATSSGLISQKIKQLNLEPAVVIAVRNGEESHAISGETWAIDKFLESCHEDGIRTTKLNVEQGFHSPCIEPSLPALQSWLEEHDMQLGSSKLAYYSSALAKRLDASHRLDARYWIDHARNPVQFVQIAASIIQDKSHSVFLDMGPQPTIWASLRNFSNPEHAEFLATSSKKGKDQDLALLHVISQMFEAGFTPNFQELYKQRNRHGTKVKIPSYPWQRQRHYPPAIISRASYSGILGRHTAPQACENADASGYPRPVSFTPSPHHGFALNAVVSSALRMAYRFLYARLVPILERMSLSDHQRNGRSPPLDHLPETISLRDQTWLVDSELLSLLDDHQIGGRKVVPGAGLAAFIALPVPGTNPSGFKSLQFHRPLEVQAAGSRIIAQISDDATFTIIHANQNGSIEKIGSGTTITPHQSQVAPEPRTRNDDPPSHIIYRNDIYSSFKGIHFGPCFQNIHQIAFWNDHAEAIIGIANAADTKLDLIRKLDPCLHMFGCMESFVNPDGAGPQGGIYLPSSLNGFIMHVQVLPDTFICRYRLPVQHERKGHVVSTSFEVLSDAGDILVTCEKYSVTWIPLAVIRQNPEITPVTQHSLTYSWVEKMSEEVVRDREIFDTLVFVGMKAHTSPILPQVLPLGSDTFVIEISECDDGAYVSKRLSKLPKSGVPERPRLNQTSFQQALHGRKTLFVLDATVESSDAGHFLKQCANIVSLLKALAEAEAPLDGLVVVSRMAFPIADFSPDVSPLCDDTLPHFTFGSAVQGIVAVWRRECGLSPNAVWGLDLPHSRVVELGQVIQSELQIRRQSAQCHSRVALRARDTNGTLARLVPSICLSTTKKLENRRTFSGVAVITGMGSIGQALAPNLIASGCKAVIYLGRTATTDEKILSALSRLRAEYPTTPVHYMQGDVSSTGVVIEALQKICDTYGSISTIIHTAGIVKDTLMTNITSESFNTVVTPKIIGGWNLHVASIKLALPLQSFVVLSSISVPLSNPGQAAYVAGNTFLESLATYRQSLGLPCLSLQLGAWESPMIEHLDLSLSAVPQMKHADGIPMIMSAMSSQAPVHLIASLNVQLLSTAPNIANDPMFRDFLIGAGYDPENCPKTVFRTPLDVEIGFTSILQELLENSEALDLSSTLGDYGIDSIAFSQVRGEVQKMFGLELPMIFLSDTFSIRNIIRNISDRLRERR